MTSASEAGEGRIGGLLLTQVTVWSDSARGETLVRGTDDAKGSRCRCIELLRESHRISRTEGTFSSMTAFVIIDAVRRTIRTQVQNIHSRANSLMRTALIMRTIHLARPRPRTSGRSPKRFTPQQGRWKLEGPIDLRNGRPTSLSDFSVLREKRLGSPSMRECVPTGYARGRWMREEKVANCGHEGQCIDRLVGSGAPSVSAR